ncbi:GIY-YIG nuclease family protein [Candidatus Gottesmanbacteria bacterium]|nr:GIY-YIG nuclease family protein [Candidatus Gottesmanbacteria bacterium]
MDMYYYVYILWSAKLHKKYVGITNNLRIRFKEHNSGKSDFTNRGKPWKLLYYEAFISREDAESEELFLKSGKGRERIKFLLKNSIGRVA